MRVLLDENVDRLLKPLFAPEFDAFVTMDASLEFQQNLRALKLGVVVLRATSNAFSVVAPLVPDASAALRAIRPGDVVHVPA